jgi:hypothetical protein
LSNAATRIEIMASPYQGRHVKLMVKRALLMFIPLQLTFGAAACSAERGGAGDTEHERTQAISSLPATSMKMKISIRTNDRLLTATLDDSEVAKDFASLLPLTLTLEDYASTEKISDLPRRLLVDGAPAGGAPSAGDLTLLCAMG